MTVAAALKGYIERFSRNRRPKISDIDESKIPLGFYVDPIFPRTDGKPK
jgi:hypothetical protein